jgi:hypothetical protein
MGTTLEEELGRAGEPLGRHSVSNTGQEHSVRSNMEWRKLGQAGELLRRNWSLETRSSTGARARSLGTGSALGQHSETALGGTLGPVRGSTRADALQPAGTKSGLELEQGAELGPAVQH